MITPTPTEKKKFRHRCGDVNLDDVKNIDAHKILSSISTAKT